MVSKNRRCVRLSRIVSTQVLVRPLPLAGIVLAAVSW